jgi:hypothetical protein
VTRAEAERIVEALVATESRYDLMVDRSATLERDWGFIVFYTTSAFLRTRSLDDALVGGGPYLVTHRDGVFTTGSRLPFEEWEAGLLLGLGRVAFWRRPFAALRSAWVRNRPHRVRKQTLRDATTYRR